MRLVSSICLIAAVGPFLRTADCNLTTASLNVISNVFRSVLANDMDWINVLKLDVKVDRNVLRGPVVEMLNELAVIGQEVRVHKVLSYLAMHSGSTRTQKIFGVQVLGMGVSCKIMGTLLVHTTILLVYARRTLVNVDNIRKRMSYIQMALPGYIEKVSFYGQSAKALKYFNKSMNKVFANHAKKTAEPQKTIKALYTKGLTSLCSYTREFMDNQCGTSDVTVIGDTLIIDSYDKNVFNERRNVISPEQLMTMIDHLDSYKFITAPKIMSVDMWMEQLDIKPFIQGSSEIVRPEMDD